MNNATIISNNYSRMTDNELLELAKTSGQEITNEALSILHDEFLKRKLDTTVFGDIEDVKKTQKEKLLNDARVSASNEFHDSLWTYAFNEKFEGISNEEIYRGLLDHGLDEEHATNMMQILEYKALENLKAHTTDMQTGGATCLVGLVITFLTYSAAIDGGVYVIAWGAIIFGAIRFINASSRKEKFKRIVANIQAEEGYEDPVPEQES